MPYKCLISFFNVGCKGQLGFTLTVTETLKMLTGRHNRKEIRKLKMIMILTVVLFKLYFWLYNIKFLVVQTGIQPNIQCLGAQTGMPVQNAVHSHIHTYSISYSTLSFYRFLSVIFHI